MTKAKETQTIPKTKQKTKVGKQMIKEAKLETEHLPQNHLLREPNIEQGSWCVVC